MTPNLKLQEAIDFMKAIDKYDYDTERFRDYLKTLISAAQSIMDKEVKQMTIEDLEKIIGNFGMFEYDYEGDYYKLSFNDFMKISPQKLQDFLDKHPTFIKGLATALFEAVYGGGKE